MLLLLFYRNNNVNTYLYESFSFNIGCNDNYKPYYYTKHNRKAHIELYLLSL